MPNNKQQTAVEWGIEKLASLTFDYMAGFISKREYEELSKGVIKQAKEKYEHEMCEFAAEYAQYELQQNKPGIKGAMVSMCAWTFFKNRKQ
jgi:hypothetical protein